MQRYGWLVAWLICMTSMGLGAIMRTVDIGGTGQYTSIQSAVTASSPGDTVLVYPGRYLENISIQRNGISVCSLEAISGDTAYIDSTIIDGRALSWGIWIRQNSQNIAIRGFSITNCVNGLAVSANSIASITNCNIYGNTGYNGAGLGLSFCTAFISGVNIFNNYAYGLGGGVYIYGYMGTVSVVFDPINRCSIYNNTAGAGQDIVAHSINNDLSIPLNMFTVPNPSSYYAAAHRAIDNEFRLLIDAHSFHHQELESDLYVSPEGDDANDGFSPATALKTIKTAIYRVASDSLNQRTVHVLPGTYSRTANQQVFPIALKSWVRVKGAGIDVTNIVGEMDPAFANLSYNPLNAFYSFHQTHASLEDMSITSSGSSNSSALAGYKEDRLQLRNLRMHDLCPDQNAIIDVNYISNCFWDGLIIEDFITESKGFLFSSGYISGVIRNSVFRNASSTFVSDEVWAEPLIWVSLGENVVIENSVFANLTMADDDSEAISFGGMYNPTVQQYYTFRNCIFSGINSNERAILLVGRTYPNVLITNCTFAGHSGSGEALMVNGVVTISNSIFYSGRSVEIAINPMGSSGITSTLTLNNNLIKDGFSDIWQAPGNTIHYMDSNIEGNPFFLGGEDIHDPLNYRLSASSPCIDSGTLDTTMLGLLPYDLARNHRIHNGRIDMGVYEYGAEPWVGLDDPLAPMLTGYSLYAYPNPFSVFANIRVALPTALNKGVAHFRMASIQVYNVKGQRVKSIALESSNKTEQYSYWDGRDDGGKNCPNGIYFLRLMLDGSTETVKKISLIRR